jgi:hypothetical protein
MPSKQLISAIAGGLFLHILTSAPTSAGDRDSLRGWGPFNFSMSLAQAKAAVGAQGIINSVGNMNYETTIDDRPFNAGISFEGAGDRIRWIELDREGIANFSMPDCHADREALQHNLSQIYGSPDTHDVEKDESVLDARSISSIFSFKDGAEIQLYERWAINKRAREGCIISIIYRSGPTRAKQNF